MIFEDSPQENTKKVASLTTKSTPNRHPVVIQRDQEKALSRTIELPYHELNKLNEIICYNY